MKIKKILVLCFFMFQFAAWGQIDSIQNIQPKKNKTFLKQSIVPLSLMGTGVFINYTHGTFSKENIQDEIHRTFPDFHTNADDFLLFVPTLTMYTADLLKIESKHDAFTQTKYLFTSLLVTNIITFGIKHATNETRPDGKDNLSFPSGHTSNAFVMATVLFHEFKNTKPVMAYSGFLFATATGTLRVLNNVHWVSDVLVGAGLGILVTDLVYRFEPFKNWNPFKNPKISTFISPSYNENTVGLYANLQF